MLELYLLGVVLTFLLGIMFRIITAKGNPTIIDLSFGAILWFVFIPILIIVILDEA